MFTTSIKRNGCQLATEEEIPVTMNKEMAARCTDEMDAKQWTVKSLAGRASPYRIWDSISLRCPLKPVQPVVLGRG